ncbi:MAG: TonB-dependent receptor, partial [Bacteroidota bacterium]
LSSVVDIRLKEGNRKYREGKLELGLISLKGMFEGPIGKKDEQGEAATSFLISGRRTFLDLFSRPAQWLSKSENRSGFSFYDLTAKINHRFEAGNEIFISFYTGNDALNLGSIDRIETDSSSLTDRLIQKLDWGNETAMIRWNKLWSKRVFSNLSVYYSRYKLGADLRKRRRIRFNGQTTENTNGSIFSSRLRELGVRWGNSWKFARQHHLRAGLQGQRYHFSPSATQFIIQEDQLLKGDSVLSAPIQSLWTGAAYVEDIFQLSQKVAGHLGFRYSAINTGSNFSSYIQTRAKLSWQIHDKLHMFLGYTENVQFLHLLSNAELPLPVDLWVPSTEKVKPALSKQVSAGWAGNFGKGTWAWQVESYYKKQSHLIAYTEGANFFDEDPSPTNLAPSTDWENEVETNGEGLSYGAELLLERNQGRLSGWISYTLGWTWRQFEGINDGKRYPFIFDRRHNLNISTGFQLSERSSIHANWIIQSGRRTSLPLGEFISIYGNSVLLYGERNNHQFPLYHRMDLAYSNRKEKPYGQRVWRIGAYNAYSRLNAYSVSVETFQGEVFLSSNSLFPIIPYLSIEWVFDKF